MEKFPRKKIEVEKKEEGHPTTIHQAESSGEYDEKFDCPIPNNSKPPAHSCTYILCKRFLIRYLKDTWDTH